MLAYVDCRKTWMPIKKPLIQHALAGMEICAKKPFGQKMYIGYYYGATMHVHLTLWKHATTQYQELIMKGAREIF